LKKTSNAEAEELKPKKMKQQFTIRDVIKQNYKTLIEKEIPFESTDKEYIGSYQRAVTTVLNNMSEEDQDEAQKILDMWNEQGPPPEVQLK
jgi:hypothetical protein